MQYRFILRSLDRVKIFMKQLKGNQVMTYSNECDIEFEELKNYLIVIHVLSIDMFLYFVIYLKDIS